MALVVFIRARGFHVTEGKVVAADERMSRIGMSEIVVT
jgi:hypothetical protein